MWQYEMVSNGLWNPSHHPQHMTHVDFTLAGHGYWFKRCQALEVLHIGHPYRELVWKDNTIKDTLWLRLLLPFTVVKNLHLSNKFAPGIAVALQDVVGDRITVVMPCLRNIFVEALEPSGPFQKNIAQFIAT